MKFGIVRTVSNSAPEPGFLTLPMVDCHPHGLLDGGGLRIEREMCGAPLNRHAGRFPEKRTRMQGHHDGLTTETRKAPA